MMKDPLRDCPMSRKGDILYTLCLAIILALFLSWGMTHLQRFAWDDDEGMNLMKAQSVRAGFELYQDIWSDQPPLFTLLLAMVFNLFGPSVPAGRILVLAFALLALLSTGLISRHIAGRVGCDEGMITFRSGRRTPPPLSVISGRRIKTGGLSVTELITVTEVYRPEAVVFWEHKLSTLPEYVAWVKAHYHPARVYDDRHQIFPLEAPQGGRR